MYIPNRFHLRVATGEVIMLLLSVTCPWFGSGQCIFTYHTPLVLYIT